MSSIKRFIEISAISTSLLWFFVFLFGSLYMTGGKILSAGGGATVFAFIPALVFFGSMLYLEKQKSRFLIFSAILFWIGIIASMIGMRLTTGMEHWPYWVLIIYLAFGALGIVQALILIALHKLTGFTNQ